MKKNLSRLLIGDDDKDDVEMLLEIIQEVWPDVELSVAYNGEEVLNLLKTIVPPDIILLDMQMPLKNGLQVTEEIRQQKDFNQVPIIILTTIISKSIVEKSIESGANKCLMKPNSFTDYKEMVKCLSEGKWDDL